MGGRGLAAAGVRVGDRVPGDVVGGPVRRLVPGAGLAEIPRPARRRHVVRSFAIVFGAAVVTGTLGATLGLVVAHSTDLSGWRDAEQALELEDLRGFVVVAYLHAAGYLGAAVGLVLAIWYVRRIVTRERSPGE